MLGLLHTRRLVFLQFKIFLLLLIWTVLHLAMTLLLQKRNRVGRGWIEGVKFFIIKILQRFLEILHWLLILHCLNQEVLRNLQRFLLWFAEVRRTKWCRKNMTFSTGSQAMSWSKIVSGHEKIDLH